jgi:hypothetical protein
MEKKDPVLFAKYTSAGLKSATPTGLGKSGGSLRGASGDGAGGGGRAGSGGWF